MSETPQLQPEDNATKHAVIAAVIAGAVSFAVYVMTMVPAMQAGDGLELATAAHCAGIAHPTGYPLYTMLLWAVMRLVPLEAITVATMMSALCMAMANGLTVRVLFDQIRALKPAANSRAVAGVAMLGAWAFAFCPVAWGAATVAEVYPFQLLLTVVFVRALQLALVRTEACVGTLCVAALCVGAGLAHHRVSVFMVLPLVVAAAICLWGAPRKKMIFAVLLLVFCAQLPVWSYLYLPLRSAQKPALNWGQPDTAERAIAHVRGGDYTNQRFLMAAPDTRFTPATYARFCVLFSEQLFADVAQTFAAVSAPQVEPYHEKPFERGFAVTPTPLWTRAVCVLILAAIFGALVCDLRRVRTCPAAQLRLLLALLATQNAALLYLYNIADIRDYELIPFWVMLVLFVVILSRWRLVVATAILVVGMCGHLRLYEVYDKSDERGMEMMSYALMPDEKELLPEGAILLTAGDFDIFPSWYRQVVRGERTDVLVFGSNFVHRSWYASYFSDEQKAKYSLKFFDRYPVGAADFVRMLREGILDKNVGKHTIITTLQDPDVMRLLAERFTLDPVKFCPIATEIKPKIDLRLTR